MLDYVDEQCIVLYLIKERLNSIATEKYYAHPEAADVPCPGKGDMSCPPRKGWV